MSIVFVSVLCSERKAIGTVGAPTMAEKFDSHERATDDDAYVRLGTTIV